MCNEKIVKFFVDAKNSRRPHTTIFHFPVSLFIHRCRRQWKCSTTRTLSSVRWVNWCQWVCRRRRTLPWVHEKNVWTSKTIRMDAMRTKRKQPNERRFSATCVSLHRLESSENCSKNMCTCVDFVRAAEENNENVLFHWLHVKRSEFLRSSRIVVILCPTLYNKLNYTPISNVH